MNNPPQEIAVLGAGGWGTALATLLAGQGRAVRLWARRPEFADLLRGERENRAYLPGVQLPEDIEISSNLNYCVNNAELVLLALPSIGLLDLAQNLPRDLAVVSCAKGLVLADGSSCKRISEVLKLLGFQRLAVLSGPNHAEEVGRGLLTATVIASEDEPFARWVQQGLSGPTLRVYMSSDVVGVELGAALKNIIALAAGMVDALSLGDNAKAALIARGLREITRFAVMHGALESTLYGLAGVGDLVATCFSKHSRNRLAGERIARGDFLNFGGQVVEGITTALRLQNWMRSEEIELPICEVVVKIITNQIDPQEAINQLMHRSLRGESI